MSRDSDPSIPSALRDRLHGEDAEGQADLEAMWDLLGVVDQSSVEAPDLEDEWAAIRKRRPEVASSADLRPASPSPNGRPPMGGGGAASSPSSRTRAERRPARRTRSMRWGRWVGALAVVFVVAVGAAWIWRQPVFVEAAPGQQRTATLPNGSTVELNSGTTLTYRRAFQAWPFVETPRRTVRLQGEAFFAVEPGARSFVVETMNARVEVTGTDFNVRARAAADSTTAVTVAEGRVRVSPRARPGQVVVLDGRGQSSRVRNDRMAPTPPRATKIDPVLVWRHNGFAVDEEPLVRVVHELEQRYDTSIRLHESVRRTNAPLTLYYPNAKPLSVILRDLCTALDLHYRPTSRGYELFSGGRG